MHPTRLQSLARHLRKAGPYVLVELLLPGGTLLALLLWLAQHHRFGMLHRAWPAVRPLAARAVMVQPAPR